MSMDIPPILNPTSGIMSFPMLNQADHSAEDEDDLGDIMTETWFSAVPHRLGPSTDTKDASSVSVSIKH